MEPNESFVKLTNQRSDAKYRIGTASKDLTVLDDFIAALERSLDHARYLRNHLHDMQADELLLPDFKRCTVCGMYSDEVELDHERHDLREAAAGD
jgi:hypothetical protein